MQYISEKADMVIYPVNVSGGYDEPVYRIRYTDAGGYSSKMPPGLSDWSGGLEGAHKAMESYARKAGPKYGFTKVPSGMFMDAMGYEPEMDAEPRTFAEIAAATAKPAAAKKPPRAKKQGEGAAQGAETAGKSANPKAKPKARASAGTKRKASAKPKAGRAK
jgi:hypothetical protein